LKVNAVSFCLSNFGVSNLRVIVVDLDINQILGLKHIYSRKISLRRLIISNQNVVEKYFHLALFQIKQHEIEEKLSFLKAY